MLYTDNQVEVQDKTSSDSTTDQANDDQAAEVQDVAELTPVVDFSSEKLAEAVEHDAVSPQ